MDKATLGRTNEMEQRTSTPATSTSQQYDQCYSTRTSTPENPFTSPEKSIFPSRHEKVSPNKAHVLPPLPRKPSPILTSSFTSLYSHYPVSSLTSHQRFLDRTSDVDYRAVDKPSEPPSQPKDEKQSKYPEEGQEHTGSNSNRDPEKASYDSSPRLNPHLPRSPLQSYRASLGRPSSMSHPSQSPHSHSMSLRSQPAYTHADLESEDDEDDERKENSVWILVSTSTPPVLWSAPTKQY